MDQYKDERIYLDTIDLLPYLKKNKDIFDVMDEVEIEDMSIEDFIDYLRKRYPDFRYYEHTEYRIAHVQVCYFLLQ